MIDLLFLSAAIPAVLFAGISKGGFAGHAAFVATPILALVIDPALALGLMLPLLMLMDVGTVRAWWGQWHRPSVIVLVAASIPGVLLGAALYRVTDPDIFRLFIGVMSIGFVFYQVARQTGLLKLSPALFSPIKGSVAGLLAGFASFVSHAGDPPMAMFLLPLRLSKAAYQATCSVVFWAINFMKAVPYAVLGFFTVETLAANLILAPVAMLGVWLGVLLHRLVSEAVFFGFAYVLLMLIGVRLIWVALG
ncbi:sulfite exporter TauE/SafE family protein [Alkalilacustris brevis]|uniref:sulfite exporter TauE/SafE family protein n=1 Tax=Alkalilacustris brevis TaxID=2026338 RepID=UPI000E0DCA5A|nr:sulfite exporter TauE/SafE family protein [Alkalilacustris brevis]